MAVPSFHQRVSATVLVAQLDAHAKFDTALQHGPRAPGFPVALCFRAVFGKVYTRAHQPRFRLPKTLRLHNSASRGTACGVEHVLQLRPGELAHRQ